MDYQAALEMLQSHGPGREDVPGGQGFLSNGFLGSLRPFSGLREENFLAVMEAIIAVASTVREAATIDRTLVRTLWYLVTTTRQWALDPDSPLQRCKLLSAEQTRKLYLWVRCIEMAGRLLFSGEDPSQALQHYQDARRGIDTTPTTGTPTSVLL